MKGANRPINRRRVERYKQLFVSNGWNWDNPENEIQIDVNGELANGWHRLTALIESGTETWWGIVEGVPVSVRMVLDTGKNRSNGDILATECGVRSNHNKLAATTAVLFRLDRREMNAEMDHAQLRGTFEDHSTTIGATFERLSGRIPASVQGAFAWVASHGSRRAKRSESFFARLDALMEQVRTGIGCSSNAMKIRQLAGEDPMAANQTNKTVTGGMNRNGVTLSTLRLIEVELRGEELKKLPYFKSDSTELVERFHVSFAALAKGECLGP